MNTDIELSKDCDRFAEFSRVNINNNSNNHNNKNNNKNKKNSLLYIF